jgi:hypothetical protein
VKTKQNTSCRYCYQQKTERNITIANFNENTAKETFPWPASTTTRRENFDFVVLQDQVANELVLWQFSKIVGIMSSHCNEIEVFNGRSSVIPIVTPVKNAVPSTVIQGDVNHSNQSLVLWRKELLDSGDPQQAAIVLWERIKRLIHISDQLSTCIQQESLRMNSLEELQLNMVTDSNTKKQTIILVNIFIKCACTLMESLTDTPVMFFCHTKL